MTTARRKQPDCTRVEVNPDDVWAVHAVVHVREMQGRVDEGIRFLVDREADWGSGNLFTVHNWWHLALFLLEIGAIDRILDIYDAEVHNAKSDGVPLEMLDASALLWRLLLDGIDTGERFAALADAWATRLTPASWYVFNDLHGIMALVGAGRFAEAERHIEELAGYVRRDGAGTNVRMASTIGLPACRAVLRFGQGRHDEVVSELLPIRRTFQIFGGSHAQRDALVRTLLESALRAGQLDLARALIAERLSLRPTSVYGWTQQARLQQALGDDDGSRAARPGGQRTCVVGSQWQFDDDRSERGRERGSSRPIRSRARSGPHRRLPAARASSTTGRRVSSGTCAHCSIT